MSDEPVVEGSRAPTSGMPVLPLRDVVVYPHMVIPLFVGREKSIVALDLAMKADKRILLVAQKQADVDDPKAIQGTTRGLIQKYGPRRVFGTPLSEDAMTGAAIGMALAGLSIGTGRSAYQTPGGQIAVTVGLLSVVACWFWSGRLMRLPGEPRVFR